MVCITLWAGSCWALVFWTAPQTGTGRVRAHVYSPAHDETGYTHWNISGFSRERDFFTKDWFSVRKPEQFLLYVRMQVNGHEVDVPVEVSSNEWMQVKAGDYWPPLRR